MVKRTRDLNYILLHLVEPVGHNNGEGPAAEVQGRAEARDTEGSP